MLGFLNEMLGNTDLPTEESAVVSRNRKYFVTTASAHVSSGSLEPQLELCCVTAVCLACD